MLWLLVCLVFWRKRSAGSRSATNEFATKSSSYRNLMTITSVEYRSYSMWKAVHVENFVLDLIQMTNKKEKRTSCVEKKKTLNEQNRSPMSHKPSCDSTCSVGSLLLSWLFFFGVRRNFCWNRFLVRCGAENGSERCSTALFWSFSSILSKYGRTIINS